jgi:ribosomal-protein-alanine N-acetyltransferase
MPVVSQSKRADEELLIRPMTLDDVDEIHAIDVLSFSLPWPKSSYRFELQENTASLALVAELRHLDQKPRLVGMIIAWLIVDEAHIASIATHPDFRRCGIGRHLLAVALLLAHQRGMRMATLELRAGNQAALELYTEFGFTIVGCRPGFYRDNQEDAILMNLYSLDEIKLRELANVNLPAWKLKSVV